MSVCLAFPFSILVSLSFFQSPSFCKSYNSTHTLTQTGDELLLSKLPVPVRPNPPMLLLRRISCMCTVVRIAPCLLLWLFWMMTSSTHTGGLILVCMEINTCMHVFKYSHIQFLSLSHTHTKSLQHVGRKAANSVFRQASIQDRLGTVLSVGLTHFGRV